MNKPKEEETWPVYQCSECKKTLQSGQNEILSITWYVPALKFTNLPEGTEIYVDDKNVDNYYCSECVNKLFPIIKNPFKIQKPP